jgi:hypothetical protein
LTAVPIAPDELSTCSSAPSHLSDLDHRLMDPCDRRLRAPAEGVTPKARRELPAIGFCIGHSNTRLKWLI